MPKLIGKFSEKDLLTLYMFEQQGASITTKEKIGSQDVTVTRLPSVSVYTDAQGKIVPVTSVVVEISDKSELNDSLMKGINERANAREGAHEMGELQSSVMTFSPSAFIEMYGNSFDIVKSKFDAYNSSENALGAFKTAYQQEQQRKRDAQFEPVV